MDFSLNEDQELFRKFVRKYLNDQEQTKVARDYIAGNVEAVKQAITGVNELGCMMVNIPDDYDGMGLGKLDLVPIMEELGRTLMPGVFLETSAFAVPIINQFATTEQKQQYLSEVASGEKAFTIAWLEPGRSYTEKGIQLEAILEQEQFTLNGMKTQVADVAFAQYLIVPIRVNGEVSIIVVDKETPGLTITAQKGFDETRQLSSIYFDNVTVPISALIGPLGDGWGILQEGLLSYNAAVSSVCVGAMEKIIEVASEYACIREQFGQAIGRYQAIKHRLADMKLSLETARSLSYYANWALETTSEDRVEAICSARIFATQAFVEIAAHNIQIHGGIGFTEEIDCHLFVKRSRFYENYLGTQAQYYDQAISTLGWDAATKAKEHENLLIS